MGVDEIITLDDGAEYVLLMESSQPDGKYFLAVEVVNGEPTENYEIFKEIFENNEYSVEEVENQELREKLIDEFENQYDANEIEEETEE